VVPARIVHKLAVVVGAEVAGLAWVVVVVVVAAVVGDANVVAVIARWLAFGVIAGVVVVVVGNLCWFGLRDWARIAISCACDVGLFLHLAAIRFGFCDFGRFGQCGGD